MSFILAEKRDIDCAKAFNEYDSYLKASAEKFPPSAYALATSDWYFTPPDHRCPHDARIKSCIIKERPSKKHRPPTIKIRLLSAYGDGFIEFEYPQVFGFSLSYTGQHYGHKDWRYDEFRVNDSGHVTHEIEWCGAVDTGRWTIEASDVIYTWISKTKP